MRARWKLVAALIGVFVLGLLLGTASGTATQEAATTTVERTETDVETTTEDVTTTVEETVTTTRVKTVMKPPPSSGVKVDYGEWKGLFKIHGARLVSQYGTPSVLGQFEYLGGGDCPLGYVGVEATFFDSSGAIIDTGLWNTDTAPKGTRLPMEVAAIREGAASRAELVVTDASCE